MLEEVSLWLSQHYDVVSVIARNTSRLSTLKRKNSHINPLALDYADTEVLSQALKRLIKEHGPIVLSVCWIHSTAPEALHTISSLLNDSVLYHILGSASADPSKTGEVITPDNNISYRRVVLGFTIENHNSRWLTHPEISQGIIEALQQESHYTIVGTVRPWRMRPQ